MIRVLIADDHTIVREGLRHLLATAGDIVVVREAVTGHEVVERVRMTDLDILLLDLSMPGKSGMELIRQVKTEKPKLKVLVLSMHEEHQYAVRAIRAGASGYLTKDSASVQLVSALRKLAAGGAFISAEVAEQLARDAHGAGDAPPHTTLSDREYQVLRMLVSGQSLTEIAEKLNLSIKTISTHKARLMQKMNAGNQAELIRYAITHKLTDDVNAG
ncbi:MAG: response regulator transcription factor [Betaproteobacteria bacterium]|nr:MAG: response regulator transcription factor [Betaproteobacteria bacterium]